MEGWDDGHKLDTDTASSALMKEMGKERREEVARNAELAKKLDVGAKDLESFKAVLIKKHKNMHRAWAKVLDKSGDGLVSKNEFFNSARDIGYLGDLRSLWQFCDADGSGFITICELAPEEAAIMSDFKSALKERYGSLYAGWVYLLDADKSGRLTEQELEVACEELGVSSEGLFDMLDVPATGFVHLEQLDPEAAAAVMRGEQELLLASARMQEKSRQDKRGTGLTGMTEAQKRASLLTMLSRKEQERVRAKLRQADKGAKTTKEFLRILKGRFRTLVRAWRTVLDSGEIGRLSFQQFCHSCRAMGYCGNLKQLWKELDEDGSGFIELKEIDEESHEALREFQEVLHRFDSIQDAWDTCLDIYKKNRLDMADLRLVLGSLNFQSSTEVLFGALDLDGGGFISVDEIEFLWKWAANVRVETWRSTLRARMAEKAKKRNRKAAMHLPPLPPQPPPLQDDVLKSVEPLLRSTLSMLPDLSQTSLRGSESQAPLGKSVKPKGLTGLETTVELTTRTRARSVGALASPSFGISMGRAYRIQ